MKDRQESQQSSLCQDIKISYGKNCCSQTVGSTDRNHESSLCQDIKILYGKNCCSQTVGSTDRNHVSLVYVKTLSSHMVRIVVHRQ
jgi:hypothetical protein